MEIINNFDEARAVLEKYTPKKAVAYHPYKLDTIRALMKYLGSPQDSLRIIHIAGTSGKTSSAYYAAALLSQSGKKVGLTVSPHVTEINERLQINMVPMPETQYCQQLTKFIEIVNKSSITPSYFEMLVAFAYWQFSLLKVDYAVIEVGLGGLLDGTNVVNRADKVCLITDIGLDHTNVLGNTLEAIALQKAGIIGERNTVFSYRQGPQIDRVFTRVAKNKNAALHLINKSQVTPNTESLPLFQQRNFYLALAAFSYISHRDNLSKLSDEQIASAAHSHIPGRMEIFRLGGKVLIIDGSHNAQKIHALVSAIKAQFPDQAVAALVSFVYGGEKRLDGAMKEISDLTNNLVITSFSGKQDSIKHSINPKQIASVARKFKLNPKIITNPHSALKFLEDQSEPILVVTGSFFLLNHIRPSLLSS